MKTLILICFLQSSVIYGFSQSQAETYIKEAQAYLAQKEYKQAQLSLQDAINDINTVLATQIIESLPAEINGLKASGTNDINTASLGMMGGGMTLTKLYRNESKQENDAQVVIVANAPMLSAMNMYLTNPAMMGQDYKSTRVGTRRAIMKTEMSDFYMDNGSHKQIRSTELQIPLMQTLITLTLRGFATEADELAFANKLDIEKLRVALGE